MCSLGSVDLVGAAVDSREEGSTCQVSRPCRLPKSTHRKTEFIGLQEVPQKPMRVLILQRWASGAGRLSGRGEVWAAVWWVCGAQLRKAAGWRGAW